MISNTKPKLRPLCCTQGPLIAVWPVVDVEEPVEQRVNVGDLQRPTGNGSQTLGHSLMVTFHINLEGSKVLGVNGHCVLPGCLQVVHHAAPQALQVGGQLAGLSVHLVWKAPVCSLCYSLPPLHLQSARTLAGPALLALSLPLAFLSKGPGGISMILLLDHQHHQSKVGSSTGLTEGLPNYIPHFPLKGLVQELHIFGLPAARVQRHVGAEGVVTGRGYDWGPSQGDAGWMWRCECGGGRGRETGQQLTLAFQLLNVCVSQEKVPVVHQLQDLQHCEDQATRVGLMSVSNSQR